jgi:hypothetical protein
MTLVKKILETENQLLDVNLRGFTEETSKSASNVQLFVLFIYVGCAYVASKNQAVMAES